MDVGILMPANDLANSRSNRRRPPPRQFIEFMSTNEINSLRRGVKTYTLHSSCAFFVNVDYFRFTRELPIRRERARTRSRTGRVTAA